MSEDRTEHTGESGRHGNAVTQETGGATQGNHDGQPKTAKTDEKTRDQFSFEDLEIRSVEEFDLHTLERLVKLEDDLFGEAAMNEWVLVPHLHHGNVYVLGNRKTHKLLGIAVLMRDWDEVDKCYLSDFGVRPDAQGKGLGTYFLKEICKMLKEEGFKTISLTVDPRNAPAVHLYRDKIGFEIKEERKNAYGHGRDRYVMELDLRNWEPH